VRNIVEVVVRVYVGRLAAGNESDFDSVGIEVDAAVHDVAFERIVDDASHNYLRNAITE
jgi:hypothetical protein